MTSYQEGRKLLIVVMKLLKQANLKVSKQTVILKFKTFDLVRENKAEIPHCLNQISGYVLSKRAKLYFHITKYF